MWKSLLDHYKNFLDACQSVPLKFKDQLLVKGKQPGFPFLIAHSEEPNYVPGAVLGIPRQRELKQASFLNFTELSGRTFNKRKYRSQNYLKLSEEWCRKLRERDYELGFQESPLG